LKDTVEVIEGNADKSQETSDSFPTVNLSI